MQRDSLRVRADVRERRTASIAGVTGVAFVALGGYLAVAGSGTGDLLLGAGCALFFGGVVAVAVRALRRARAGFTLDTDGVRVGTGTLIPWDDVAAVEHLPDEDDPGLPGVLAVRPVPHAAARYAGVNLLWEPDRLDRPVSEILAAARRLAGR